MIRNLAISIYLLIQVDFIYTYCLYTNLDVNSVTIPNGERLKEGCQRNVGAAVGCIQQFRCNPDPTPDSFGYYVVGDTIGNGVKIECITQRWVLASDKTTAPRCVKGCRILTNKEMENSTYVGEKPGNIFRNGAQEYYALQTVVQTSCKEGYIFKNEEHEKKRQDQHRCTANQGWLDMINHKAYGYPAVCRAICDPFDARDIPNNVKVVTNALDVVDNVRDYNGRKVLVSGSTYKFQCEPGFDYAAPHSRTGFQILTCAGGKDFWYDSETGKNSARPASCIASGCPALSSLNIVEMAVISNDTNCVSNGMTVNNGCRATIRCNERTSTRDNQGYYMQNNPNGYLMTCNGGKWLRPDGTEAKPDRNGKFGEACSLGCLSLTEVEQQSSRIIQETGQKYKNGQEAFSSLGSLIVTTCNEGFIRPNILNQDNNQLTFICSQTGWTNSDSSLNSNGNSHPASCVRSCMISLTSPVGTKVETSSQIIRRNSLGYVVQNSTVTISCENGFKPPNDLSSPRNLQVLQCVGGSQGWRNTENGQVNFVPMVCVRNGSVGCTLVDVLTHPHVEIDRSSSCIVVDGKFPQGCELSLRCKKGYLPSLVDASINPAGNQELVCKAEAGGTVGYASKLGTMNDIQPINCVAACEVVTDMITATYTKPPTNVVTYGGQSYLKSGEEVSIKCKVPDYDVNNYADQSAGDNILYRCFGGEDKYLRLSSYRYNTTPGDACSGVCKELEGTVKAGTLLTSVYKTDSIVNIRDGIRYVVNIEYNVKCASGYDFTPGTSAANLGYQRLLCSSLSEGYLDLDTGMKNTNVIECIPNVLPKCEKIDETLSKVEIIEKNNCSEQNGFSVGCSLTVRCQNGTYSETTNSNTQKLICATNAQGRHSWEISGSSGSTLLNCRSGCSNFLTTDDFIIKQDSSSNIDSVKYYKEGSSVVVECATGRFPTLHSGVSRTENNQFTYVCMPNSVDGRSWRNVISRRIELFPGSLCGKACHALNTDGKGLDIISRPEEFGISSLLVVGESSYQLRCKPGHSYESSSHQTSGQQTLFCDPKTANYIDFTNSNKTPAALETCVMNPGSGCPDITVPNSDLSYTNCNDGFKNGCEISITCKSGFIPSETRYHSSGKQVLVCSNGIAWKEKDGQEVSKIVECVAACRMDNATITQNVVISKDLTKKYVVEGVTYIMEGESVSIKCQGNTVIWETEVSLTDSEHLFVCSGGSRGFIRNEDHKSNVLLGEGCVATCLPLSLPNLTNLNLVVNSPVIITYGPKQLVAPGSEYSFTCINNYIYPPGSQSSQNGFEKFRCVGASGSFVNSVTNEIFSVPTACTRNPRLDECVKLTQDFNRVVETSSFCYDLGNNFYSAGCSIDLKCKTNFMPESSAYFIPSGQQKIVCGYGGAGWKDQFGTNITEGLKCIPGCKPYENSHEYIRIHEKIFYINGLKIECKEIDVIKNQTSSGVHPYYCENGSSNNVTDKGCTNACKQIVTLPPGVEIFKEPEPKQLEQGYPYVAGNSQYVFRCQNGFTYASSSAHFSLGRQTLNCNPVTNQYDDVDTKVANAQVEACAVFQGCSVMTRPENVLEAVGNSGCTRNAGFFSDGCQIQYKCSSGFYPTDKHALYSETQLAVCSGARQSWLDREGNPLSSITTCLPGCVDMNITELVTLLYEPTSISFETFSDLYHGSHGCYARSMYTKLTELIEQVRQSDYICDLPSQTNQTLIDGNHELLCLNACPIISSSSLPEGVRFYENPISFNPYGRNAFIGVNKNVVLQCQNGYEYQSGSIYAGSGKQEFKCNSQLQYFDIQANIISSVIQPCRQVAGSTAPPGSNINRTVDDNCQELNGFYRIGCKLTIKCIEGAYPLNSMHYQMVEQYLELVADPLDGPVWVDSITKFRVDYLSCAIGCLPLSVANLNITTTTVTARYGSITAKCQMRTEDMSIGMLPNGTARYFCELQSYNSTANTSSPCTNVCKIPTYDRTLTLRVAVPLSAPFSQYMILTSPVYALCPPGEQWIEMGQAQRAFVCTENNIIRDSQTQQIVNHIQTNCA